MKRSWFVIFVCVVVLILFFSTRYIVQHREGYGAVDYVNTNIPIGFQFTAREESISDTLRMDPNYITISRSQIDQDNGTLSKKFYCASFEQQLAEIVDYFTLSAGYNITGGWSYRYAVVCGDEYLIVDGADHFGEALYGPFLLR